MNEYSSSVVLCQPAHISPDDRDSIPQIPRMRSVYQLRTIKENREARRLFYRYACCWCRNCIIGDYNSCSVHISGVPTRWIQFDLALPLFESEKQIRCCSHCKKTGHNIRNCEDKIQGKPATQGPTKSS